VKALAAALVFAVLIGAGAFLYVERQRACTPVRMTNTDVFGATRTYLQKPPGC
jgi:hypothetical protein